MKFESVTIYTAPGLLQAEIVRSLLESAGIPVQLVQESAGAVYALTVGPLGEVEVRVPVDHAAQAEALIAAMERGDLETDDNSESGAGSTDEAERAD